MKHDLIPLIDVLASNTSLSEIDISGHQIGNTGVIALAKSLQLNGTLTKLFWDENETGLIGYLTYYIISNAKLQKYKIRPQDKQNVETHALASCRHLFIIERFKRRWWTKEVTTNNAKNRKKHSKQPNEQKCLTLFVIIPPHI